MDSDWKIFVAKNEHGVSLPDGKVFERIGGTYIEKPALDSQSGKWNYAVATGTVNALRGNTIASTRRTRGSPIDLYGKHLWRYP